MSKKNIAFSAVIFLLSAGMCYSFYRVYRLDKIVVVDVVKVFNEFKMKKEMEQKIEGQLRAYSQQVDSLEALYKAVSAKADSAGARYVKTEVDQLKTNAAQFYDVSNKQINEQVWNRLNPLLDDYGRKNNIRILMGANGMGSVLYRDTTADKTSEVIKFVNDQYENLN